jgi:hypothetical protein
MDSITWLWATITELAWWQLILMAGYTLYFILRAWAYWDATEDGLWKGFRKVLFKYDTHFRVYHIVRILFDIPPMAVGLLFPVLRNVLKWEICSLDKGQSKVEGRLHKV